MQKDKCASLRCVLKKPLENGRTRPASYPLLHRAQSTPSYSRHQRAGSFPCPVVTGKSRYTGAGYCNNQCTEAIRGRLSKYRLVSFNQTAAHRKRPLPCQLPDRGGIG